MEEKHLYFKENDYKLYKGAMQDVLSTFEKNSIDSIVCDPPYELNFMGKGWDNSGVAFQPDTWKHCYDVLKEGGYLLAFGGSRTFHRIAVAIEDAGFEIRDTIMWLYGSGFPKSQNIGLMIDKKNGVESEIIGYETGTSQDFKNVGKKQKEISGINKLSFGQVENSERKRLPIYKAQNEWSGWGTCLKPAYEPVIVARKPFKGSLVENIIQNGVGGLNIDECRVPYGKETDSRIGTDAVNTSKCGFWSKDKNNGQTQMYKDDGRFPANVILTYDENDFNEVCGGFPNTKSTYNENGKHENVINRKNSDVLKYGYKERIDTSSYNDEGNASRYFYCAKASKKDRDEGLNLFEEKLPASAEFRPNHYEKALNGETGNPYGRWKPVKNIHPTVKPTELMQYLVRLVSPKGATILDCFMGSGSTGKAVMFENRERNANYKFVGIEMTEEYLPIAKARIDYAKNQYEYEEKVAEIERKEKGITNIFDFME